jgi:hypothetical protein
MRMDVFTIMEIDKSLRVLKELPQKSIDPPLVRSLPKNDFITDLENSQIVTVDPSTQPCRDCPEGMQW